MWPVKPQMVMQSNGPNGPMLIQNKMSKKQIVPQEHDRKCQATKCYKKIDKNSQTSVMQSVTRSSNKKVIGLSMDKNCQATRCAYNDSYGHSTVKVCSDKNCQEIIQPVMPEMNMWLPKPAIRRLCSDKNCQSTGCYKKYEDTKYDKNCQSV